MAYTFTLDLSAPAGGDAANDLDGYIRDGTKNAIMERIADMLIIADSEADPIVPTGVKLNRTASSKILIGTTRTTFKDDTDTTEILDILDTGEVKWLGTSLSNRLVTDFTTVQKTATDNFKSLNISANTLHTDGMGLRITSAFLLTDVGSGDNRLEHRWSGTQTTVINFTPSAGGGVYAGIVSELYRESSSTMIVFTKHFAVDIGLLAPEHTAVHRLTGLDYTVLNAVTSRLTVGSTADVTQRMWTVELIRA